MLLLLWSHHVTATLAYIVEGKAYNYIEEKIFKQICEPVFLSYILNDDDDDEHSRVPPTSITSNMWYAGSAFTL